MARALLVEARMPKRYWFWALREAIIHMNLLPCQPLTSTSPASPDIESGEFQLFEPATMENARRGKAVPISLTTPFELFYGTKPDYHTLFH
jgi:hypothetical protein